MDIQAPYYRQVALLMQVLPYVAVEREFALKGGTAINLFIRDFPRLSVDIDLAWVPLVRGFALIIHQSHITQQYELSESSTGEIKYGKTPFYV